MPAVAAVRDERLKDEVEHRSLNHGAYGGKLDALPDNAGINGMTAHPDPQAAHPAVSGAAHRGFHDPLAQAKFVHVAPPVR